MFICFRAVNVSSIKIGRSKFAVYSGARGVGQYCARKSAIAKILSEVV